MRCPRCRHENPPQAKFCSECGSRVATRCARCREELPAAAKFCPECGQPVSGWVPPQFTSPEAYTPKHLVESILTSRNALEGERKQVTVLFADLKGSMELLADQDPEAARGILDPVLERMMAAVHHYEGTVNQVMGDGIMALFGAPIAHEDHAVRACYAALKMQESVTQYAQEAQRAFGVPVTIRVGLNSGEVVVRAIGSDLRMDYTAVGQTTHLAARMEQMARPGSVLITTATLDLAEGHVQVIPLGPMPVKGLDAPIDVYELRAASPARSRLQARAARGLTRFVGRQAEVEVLAQALERARTGHGQIVALVGEPGVGKSRLLREFVHSHRTHGWLVVETGSASYGKATPYQPVIDLLKAYFQIEPRDAPRRIREKVTGKVLSLDPALEPSLPAILSLLDALSETSRWEARDPQQRRHVTLEALKRILFCESHVQPLCLVVEDLHWIDSETQGLLDILIESLPATRILLLVNYRPEYRHGWGNKTYYTQLRIDPLPPDSVDELLRALLGEDPGLKPVKQFLIAQTQGNPFFLEESVRTLLEIQVIRGERGAFRLAKALPGIQVPATVQAVLAARIDRLDPGDKHLLQSAAVIGETVPFTVLHAIADLPEDGLRSGLSRLQTAEFLYETSLFPDLEFTFKHGLTYQVAYNSLLVERRRVLHERILASLERLYHGRLAEHIERLALHSFRAEAWEKALTYLRQAGAKAVAHSAHRGAVTHFEQALVALRHLEERRDTLEQAIDVRFDLRTSLIALGEIERVPDCLHEAEILAKSLDDQLRLAWVSVYLAHYFWATGDQHRAVASGRRALILAAGAGDLGPTGAANVYLGAAYHARGDYRQAMEVCGNNLEALEAGRIGERDGGSGLLSVISRTWLVWSLAERGEFAEGIARGEEAVRIAETADHPFSILSAYFGIGGVHLRKGSLHQAIPILERGLVRCQLANIPIQFPRVASVLGYIYALSGRLADALPLLEQAVAQASSMKLMFGHSLWVGWLGETYLLAGRSDEALECAERALKLATERGERGNRGWILRLLGDIAFLQDLPDVDDALARYRDAIALAREFEMRPLLAHCHFGCGRLCHRSGRREQAREHLDTAMTMFREMDMQFWLEKAEAANRGD